MEKRVLLAIFLVFIVLFAYQAYFLPAMPPARPAPAVQQAAPSTATPAGTVSEAARTPAAGAGKETPVVPAAGEPPAAVVTDAGERRLTVETNLLRVEFSNRGGRATLWQLTRFKGKDGAPVDLVPQELAASAVRPFELKVDDEQVTARLRQAIYRVEGAGGDQVDGRRQAVSVTFEFADAAGLRASKSIRFTPDSYVVEASADVTVGGQAMNPTVLMGPGLGDVHVGEGGRFIQKAEGIFHRDGKVDRLATSRFAAAPAHEGAFQFVGVDDHYFLSVALPTKRARVEYGALTLPDPAGKQPLELVSYGIKVSGRADGIRFYLGPKEFEQLAGVDRELVRTINYGMFAWLVVPLLRGLKYINQYVGNYGWSIIIFTVLMNAAMFPLRHKSVVSMRRMQELQPEIKAIQERYKGLKTTDPARQKMNQEMMELYKTRGVNPASGCIPLVLTLPVFFAFYSLLSQSIELRGAPFTLWIKDLSVFDPYYVTPILMGVSWLWQQWITPSSADPMQQKMMLAMPVVFTVTFLWAPSGLAIYWFMNNLLAIGQQYVTNALAGPPPVPKAAGTIPGRVVRKSGGVSAQK